MNLLTGSSLTKNRIQKMGLLVKTLLFFFLFSVLVLPKAFAAGVDSFTITPQAAATSLDLTTNQSNLPVAAITLGSSGTKGQPKNYEFRVQSQYGGLRNTNAVTKGATTTASTIPYTVTYGVTTTVPASQNTLTINSTATQVLFSYTDGSNNNVTVTGNIRFSINGAAAANLFSGTYTDTLTLNWYNISGASTITKTLTITSAVVADTITLTVTPTASASNLPLSVSQSNLNVGTVSITANCQNGYVLQLASAYSSQLRNTQYAAAPAANEKIDYTMTFNGTSVSPTTTPVTVASSSSATLLTTTTQIGNVNISYTGVSASVWKAGTYQDYLTFTLTSQ